MSADLKYFVSFFSGGGGFDLGLSQAGFTPALCSDIEEFSELTHQQNFPDVPFLQKDIRTIKSSEIKNILGSKKISLVCGGPPCQGFTNMGDKLSADPRNAVLESFLRLTRTINPEAVLVENVPGMKNRYNGSYYKALISGLEDQGFSITSKIVSFTDFGVPQLRKRLIIVGIKGGSFDFSDIPKAIKFNRLNSYSNVGEAFAGLPKANDPSMPNHTALNHSDIVIRRYQLIPQGGKLPPKEMLPEDIRRENFGNTYQRLHLESPATTMVPGNNAFPIHPIENRSLTPREAARIQTFPDDYIFHGTRARQCLQIGNAVPPLAAALIGNKIKDLLDLGLHSNSSYMSNQRLKTILKAEVDDLVMPPEGTEPLTVVDLFSGIGGFASGFKKAGFKVLLKSDNSPWVAQVSKSNFPNEMFIHGDLSQAKTKEIIKVALSGTKVNVLVGGPPCQGFSLFGKRRFAKANDSEHIDQRNDLVDVFAEYAGLLQPDWVIMENVPGIETLNDGIYVKNLYEKLAEYGYTRIEHKILNTADYGVPQTRRRFLLIATKTNLVFPWPKQKYFSKPEDWQKPYRSVAEVLTDLDEDSQHQITNHNPPKHHPLVAERFSYIEPGKKLEPEKLPPHLLMGLKTGKTVGKFSKVTFRLHPNMPAPTLVPGHNAFPVHPWLNRTLTIREAARIQTLPDNIQFLGPIIQQGLQVGNAFPSLLAQILAERLLRIINNDWDKDTISSLAKYSMLDFA